MLRKLLLILVLLVFSCGTTYAADPQPSAGTKIKWHLNHCAKNDFLKLATRLSEKKGLPAPEEIRARIIYLMPNVFTITLEYSNPVHVDVNKQVALAALKEMKSVAKKLGVDPAQKWSYSVGSFAHGDPMESNLYGHLINRQTGILNYGVWSQTGNETPRLNDWFYVPNLHTPR